MISFQKLIQSKPHGSIPINWPGLLAFAAFWTYGLFAAISFNSLIWQAASTLVLGAIFVAFFLLLHKTKIFRTEISWNRQDLFVVLSFAAVIIGIGMLTLNQSLQGDELYTSRHAQILFIFILEKLSLYFTFLNSWQFNWTLYAANLSALAGLILAYRFLKKTPLALKVTALSLMFIVFRFILFFSGSNNDPFPALRLFPLWLSSAIFSPSALTFRIGTVLGLLGLMWFLQRQAQKHLSLFNSWLFALAVGTIPVLWHISLIIEPSVWAAVCWTILVFYMANYQWDKSADWFGLFSLIAVFSLMRQSVFIAIAPVGLMFIIDNSSPLAQKSSAKFQILFHYARQIWQIFKNPRVWLTATLPILVMLPFTLKSLVSGTPATHTLGFASYIPHESWAIARIWFAVKSGIAWHAIVNSTLPYWLIFLPFSFLPFGRKQTKNSAVLLFFFALAFCMFYTIVPSLWVLSKYQSEYIIPFVILGFFWIIIKLNGFTSFGKKIITILCAVLIAGNIFVLLSLPKFNPPTDSIAGLIPQGLTVLAESPYDFHEALVEAKISGFAGHTALIGDINGALNEIMSGYTVSEVKAQESIYAETLGRPEIDIINSDKRIQLVLMADITLETKNQTRSDLIGLGWKDWKNFTNKTYGSTVVGLVRE